MSCNNEGRFLKRSKLLCDKCEYKASRQDNLRRHTQAVHNGIKYFCELCECHAITEGDFKKHKESIHKGVKYSCDQCEHQKTQKKRLKKHKQSDHEEMLILLLIPQFELNI